MYFEMFPKGKYDIKGDGNKKLVTDLFRRVKIRAKIKDEASLISEYVVPPGETPEVTAMKHFGNTELHWVILLTNDIQDRYYDWPLSYQDFENYLKDKYTLPEGIHHFEKVQSSGPQSSIDQSHLIEVTSDTVGAVSVSNREYEQRLQDKKARIKLISPTYLPILLEEFERLVSV